MSILVNKDTKVIVQGFTGKEATFHAEQCMAYGTKIVGGVTPNKGGQEHLGKPVFNTVKEAVANTGATVSLIFVPPAFVGDAVMEAADAGIELAVIITEGAPVKDMMYAKAYATKKGMMTIGPNCPGIITAEECKLGIMPGFGGTQRLSRLVGKAVAKELCMTGRIISADEAKELGIVNKVFPKESLWDETMKVANEISNKGRISLRAIKRTIDRGFDLDLRSGCYMEADNFGKMKLKYLLSYTSKREKMMARL